MSTYRKPATDEARERANARQREYRATHPESVIRWRTAYILRKADRLRADQAQQVKGGADHD